MLATDWSAPTSVVLGRLPDRRVSQYWDHEHLLAQQMSKDARDSQPKPDCCRRDGFLWDLAALYPPGTRWDERMPTAIFFNGPIVKVNVAGAFDPGAR
jgi:hypothetical protein